MFKSYVTRSKEKSACQITGEGVVRKIKSGVSEYCIKKGNIHHVIEINHEAGYTPSLGDYLVEDGKSTKLVKQEAFDKVYRQVGSKK